MKLHNVWKKYGTALVVGGSAVSGSALAQTGQSYAGITSAVDFATAAAAIIGIFALVAVMKVAMAGGRKVLGAIR